ncbi:hypothetical protein TIFTF001_034371 [Ficus carica]|uniref:Uncharacterized protein n=1 Tax=Ficus carica TaxID=3494 RepID=A0AA88E0A5_FICCA|nr:hypothetical protein TIFTF001_034371 [Ficus carica]
MRRVGDSSGDEGVRWVRDGSSAQRCDGFVTEGLGAAALWGSQQMVFGGRAGNSRYRSSGGGMVGS